MKYFGPDSEHLSPSDRFTVTVTYSSGKGVDYPDCTYDEAMAMAKRVEKEFDWQEENHPDPHRERPKVEVLVQGRTVR